jgi:O-antigen/teichoic acid export membrane protein/glycosyltransferase involved in cell wall biosynthesis
VSGPIHQPDTASAASAKGATREGYALVLNAVITSAVGLGFWIYAARKFEADEVGIGTSLVNVIVLLSSIVSINCGHALQRVLPIAYRRRSSLVLSAYAVSAGIAFIGALLVWGFKLLPADIRAVDSSTLLLFLAGGAAVSAVFQVQDAAFIGLRSAGWIPIENTLYGIVKLAALVLLASQRGSVAIVLATIACIPPAVVGMNWLLFRRLIYKRFGSENDASPALSRRALTRFIAGDSVAVMSYLIASLLLPTVIAAMRTPADAAFFSVPWMIYTTQRLIANQMAAPVIVEAAINPTALWQTLRRILRRSMALTLIGSAGAIVAAPIGLGIFGADYSRESTTTMRILAVAAIPHAISTFGWSVQRIHGATRLLLTSSIAIAALGLPLVIILVPRYGIKGAAYGWLAAEIVGAMMLLPETIRSMRAPTARASGRPLRVLHLVSSDLAPLLAVQAVDTLVRRGDVVHVAGIARRPGPFEAATYETVPVLDRIRRHPIAGVLAVARLLRTHRPDVVHAHTLAPAVAARLASVVHLGTVVVVTNEHLEEGKEWRSAQLLRLAGASVLTSSFRDAQRLHAAGLAREQVYVVPASLGVPAPHFESPAGDVVRLENHGRIRVLGVGSLNDVEGWTSFIDALVALRTAQGVIVGDGPFRAELERYASRVGVAIQFVGFSEAVMSFVRDSDVFLATSPSGVTATIVRSAASARVPSVLTRRCLTTDILGHQSVFVSANDSPETVAATVRHALDAPSAVDPVAAVVPAESDQDRLVQHYLAGLLGDAG